MPVGLAEAGAVGDLEGKPQPIQLVPKVPYWTATTIADSDGIIAHRLPDGGVVYNIGDVAVQALGTADPAGTGHQPLSDSQKVALRWLARKAAPVRKGAIVWRNDFELDYNNLLVCSPWPSAYSQAMGIRALINAYEATGEGGYLSLARKAAAAYSINVEKGGLARKLPGGMTFFEEVPVRGGGEPHILNGHLLSALALVELSREGPSGGAVASLAEQGLKTLHKVLGLSDSGRWTRYDLSPRLGEIHFTLSFYPGEGSAGRGLLIDTVRLRHKDVATATILDVGRSDDAQGAWRISGGSWEPQIVQKGRSVRELRGDGDVWLALPNGTAAALLRTPYLALELEYLDKVPGLLRVGVQGNRGNTNEVFYLSGGIRQTYGDGKWKVLSVKVPLSYLGWWGVPASKIKLAHIGPLYRLYEFTKDPYLLEYATRWEQYVEEYEAMLAGEQGSSSRTQVPLDSGSEGGPAVTLTGELKAAAGPDASPAKLMIAINEWIAGTISNRKDFTDPLVEVLRERSLLYGGKAQLFVELATQLGYRARVARWFNFPALGQAYSAVEVWYESGWHYFDPTTGVYFTTNGKPDGPVSSQRDLVLAPDLVEFSAFPATRNVTLLNPNTSSEKPVDSSTYYQAYYTRESVEQAGPWGPLDPSLPLFFPIPVDASAAQGPVLARFGKPDLSSSAADFDDLNTSSTPNPAGIYVLGTMGSNFNHRYHFHGLKARRCYRISMWISHASAPNLVFRAWGKRARITAGQVWHVPFTEYSKTKQLWNVQFESDGSEAEITLYSDSREGGKYILFNYIEVQELPFFSCQMGHQRRLETR